MSIFDGIVPTSKDMQAIAAAPEDSKKTMHLYVWTREPFFYAVAQAISVAEARMLLLDEIGGGDGSCPERESAARWVREQGPAIWHYANAEFALTDSAELREAEAHSERLERRIKELESLLAAKKG